MEITLSPSFRSIIIAVAQKNLYIVCLGLEIGDTVLVLPLLHMNFVSKLTTLTSINILLSSILTQTICGIVYLLQFFLPLTICLPLNVRCTSTCKLSTSNISFSYCKLIQGKHANIWPHLFWVSKVNSYHLSNQNSVVWMSLYL